MVVTGGGAGIGRALALGLAAAGARVVVNDLDAGAAAAVAARAGGYAVPGDAATEQGVRELIAAARKHLGEIDIYCSNAGIAAGTGPDTPDPVLAAGLGGQRDSPRAGVTGTATGLAGARARLLHRDRVGGRAAHHAGSAPYSVTKHAAEAYAEWLAATYGHRGLVVHCICPQGVRTNMLAESGQAGQVVLQDAAIEPEQVADALLEGIAAGRFLILPHPEVRGYYELRASDTDKWLRGMNRMQQRIEEVERGTR